VISPGKGAQSVRVLRFREGDRSSRKDVVAVEEPLEIRIEERTGEPTRFFAYPSGQYDDLTIKVLESANFWAAVTTEWGAVQSYANRFEMPRIRVRGNDTVKELAEKLEFFK